MGRLAAVVPVGAETLEVGTASVATDPVETRVVLRCEGGYVGEVVNQRWLRMPCRQRRCRGRDGAQTVVHTWDLLTGRRSTNTEPIATPPGELPG